MSDICFRRLEELKQVVLLNYLDSINLDQPKEFYEVLVKKLFEGALDQHFHSESLIGIDFEESKEIFQLVRKYKNLCFYLGDFRYWADSIGGVYLNDLDLVTMKLLDHYDFLLGLAKDGGEDALKQLMAFNDSFMSKEGSVVDYLRNRFDNDDLLKEVIFEMTREDGELYSLSDVQKRILCTYPEGTLYHRVDNYFERIPTSSLIQMVGKYLNVEKAFSFKELPLNDENFEDIIFHIYTNGS